MNAPSSVAAELELVFRERRGVTYLAEQYVRAPLKVWRPFPLPDGRVLLQIVNVSPGLMAGDHYRLTVTVTGGAKLVLVNQSATKVHRMPAGEHASQEVNLHVENGGELEYYPGLTIPFPESDFTQRTCAQLATGGCFGMLEAWAMGRTGRGEHLAFRRLSSRTFVFREGRPVYADALELEPHFLNVCGWGVLEGHKYLANGCWWWREVTEREAHKTSKPASPAEPTLVCGALPSQGEFLRAMYPDGFALSQTLQIWVNGWRRLQHLPCLGLARYSG